MPIPAGHIVQVAYPVLSGDFFLGSLVQFCSTEPRFWHHVREDDNVFPEVPWSIITLLANTLANSSSLLLVRLKER